MFIDQVVIENGLVVAHDVYGRIHVLAPSAFSPTPPGVPLDDYVWKHAYHTDVWPNTPGFHDLYNTNTATQFSITANANLLINTIILAQTGNNVVSLVDLRKDGVTFTILPVLEENIIHLSDQIIIPYGSVLTAKVKPGHKNTEVAITVGGYYT